MSSNDQNSSRSLAMNRVDTIEMENKRDFDKAARCGEPSYVWRSGQQRRLNMILQAAGERIRGRVLENGCGVGMYVDRLAPLAGRVIGLEYDLARAAEARLLNRKHPNSEIINAAGEKLPFSSNSFDLILSHEVLEHVEDDRAAASEMARILRPGGRIALFVPNRGYPFETHGVYWRGRYHFGNIFGINYLPRAMRDRLAPHVRIYSSGDLVRLFRAFAAATRTTHHYLRRIRQHHCPQSCRRAQPKKAAARSGKHAFSLFRFIAFLDPGKKLILLRLIPHGFAKIINTVADLPFSLAVQTDQGVLMLFQ